MNICTLLKTKLCRVLNLCEKKGITNVVISTERMFLGKVIKMNTSQRVTIVENDEVPVVAKEEEDETLELLMP